MFIANNLSFVCLQFQLETFRQIVFVEFRLFKIYWTHFYNKHELLYKQTEERRCVDSD